MTHPDAELLAPGRFAALTMLSPKALRVYAERGLLVPARTDPATGYRHYAAAQVRTGWLIGLLRSAGLPLDEVEAVLRADPGSAQERLDAVVADQHRRSASVLAVLDRARHHLREEHAMTGTAPLPGGPIVTTAVEPDRAVLSTTHRLGPGDLPRVVPAQVDLLVRAAAAAGLRVTGPPFGVFHAPVTDDSDGPFEVALPVDDLPASDALGAADPEGGSGVRAYRLTGGLVATRDAVGEEAEYPAVLAVYDEVRSWIAESGHLQVGPPREVWHTGPGDDRPRTSIAWPYAPVPG